MTNTAVTDGLGNPDPLFTIAEAAGYLGVSERSVRRALETDKVAGTYLGRLVRIRRSALELYITGQTK